MCLNQLSRVAIALGLLCGGFLFAHRSAADEATISSSIREWTDSTGRFHMVGSLIGGDRDQVRLQRKAGPVVVVAVTRLSAEDQEFVFASLAAMLKEAERSMPTSALEVDAESEAVTTIQEEVPAASPSMKFIRQWWSEVAVPSVQDVYRVAKANPLLSNTAARLPENMIYVKASGSFLRRMAWHDVNRTGTVSDDILEAHVVGVSQTTGHMELKLLPCKQAGLAELHFTGTTNFNVVGYAGPIRLYSTGVTQLDSVKTVWIDGQGIHSSPAQTQAKTASQINGIETSLRRLLGRISLRIAEKRSAESHQMSDVITAEHTVRQVNSGFDASTTAEVNELWKNASAKLAALSSDNPLRPRGLRATSTEDGLQVVVLGRSGQDNSLVAEPVFMTDPADLEVQIHVSAVRKALVDKEISALLRPVLVHFASMPHATSANRPAIHWSDDGKWLCVAWKADEAPPDSRFVKYSREK